MMQNLMSSIGGALCGLLLVSLPASAQELRFRWPFSISSVPGLVTVQAGDLDADGKLDLMASNRSGVVTVYFQDQENRNVWAPLAVPVGESCSFTRAGDFRWRRSR